jgi:hypothetical protein
MSTGCSSAPENLANLIGGETSGREALDEAFSCSPAERPGAAGLKAGDEQLVDHSLAGRRTRVGPTAGVVRG